MAWASRYIERLRRGETVSFRPQGDSMRGIVESGQLVTVEPVDPASLQIGDVVLCNVAGGQYLHLVKDIDGAEFLIGNNRGKINGWTSARQIHGRLVKVED